MWRLRRPAGRKSPTRARLSVVVAALVGWSMTAAADRPPRHVADRRVVVRGVNTVRDESRVPFARLLLANRTHEPFDVEVVAVSWVAASGRERLPISSMKLGGLDVRNPVRVVPGARLMLDVEVDRGALRETTSAADVRFEVDARVGTRRFIAVTINRLLTR